MPLAFTQEDFLVADNVVRGREDKYTNTLLRLLQALTCVGGRDRKASFLYHDTQCIQVSFRRVKNEKSSSDWIQYTYGHKGVETIQMNFGT